MRWEIIIQPVEPHYSPFFNVPIYCPLAAKPQLPVDFEEVTWAKLKEAVHAVHEKRRISTSLEELYMVRGSVDILRPLAAVRIWEI